MLRIESRPAGVRRPDRRYGRAESDRRDAFAALASLTPAQRGAVASFTEAARPWLDLGLGAGETVSAGDMACVLEIVADGLRLERHRDRPAPLG